MSCCLSAGCAVTPKVQVVDLARERCPQADQTAVEQGKARVHRPKPDAITPDGKAALKAKTVMTWIDAHETGEEAKARAIERLARDHEACRLGAETAVASVSP